MQTPSMTLAVPQTDRFYFRIVLTMTALVFMGFGPTFYWRTLTDNPPLPTIWVTLHAVANTLWLILILAQTALVAQGRTDLHRRLGKAGAVLAVAIVFLGLYTVVDFVRREPDTWLTEASFRFFIPASFTGILTIAGFVAAALVYRRRPAFHKRFMVLATLVMMSAAFARLPVLSLVVRGLPFWRLLGWIVVHDYRTEGRLHPANFWGTAVLLLRFGLIVGLGQTNGLDAVVAWGKINEEGWAYFFSARRFPAQQACCA